MENSTLTGLEVLFASGIIFSIIMALIIWSIVWKGIALWKAARLGQKKWFVALLIINTAGILEIIYIFAVARKKMTGSRLSTT